MRVKTIEYENFNNYKEPSMFIGTISCHWKCCIEAGISCSVCQNHEWINSPIMIIDDMKIINRYMSNMYTNAIVFGGLEPFEQFEEIYNFIETFREYSMDTVVIYTGYDKREILDYVHRLQNFRNIIIKFGRYIPNSTPIYDELLGVTLISNNQHAIKIS